MLGRHLRARQQCYVVRLSLSLIDDRQDAVGGGCAKATTVTCSKLGAYGNVSAGDAAAGPESLCPATCGLSDSAAPRKGPVREETFFLRNGVDIACASASTLHAPSDAQPFRLLEACLFLRRSYPPVRNNRAAGSPFPPSSTASEASSARQTRPLAPRRQCSVTCLCFSTPPRATNAPPSPRHLHRGGGVGATAADARHVTVRVCHPSGPSAPVPTRT